MGKKAKENAASAAGGYKETLYDLQVELVKLQRHLIKNELRILFLLEDRDAWGKDGVIKRIAAYLSPRDARVVALGKPSDLDRNSWHNSAGAENVMGFCTAEEHEEFRRSALPFERMLFGSGTQIFKYVSIYRRQNKRKDWRTGGLIRSSNGRSARSTRALFGAGMTTVTRAAHPGRQGRTMKSMLAATLTRHSFPENRAAFRCASFVQMKL